MKKIDLHIHTSPASYEANFDFSIEKLKEYIIKSSLDIIAITNHNHFDRKQFEDILKIKECTIFPGIEVDIEKSHLLVISPIDKLDEFTESANILKTLINSENDTIDYDKFVEIFSNYRDYILIPHIDKKPIMSPTTLKKFEGIIKTGEVGSPKKFEISKKRVNTLVPVLFSDQRISKSTDVFSNKCTYVETDSSEFNTLKLSLSDKNKVFLNKKKKENDFAYLLDDTPASTHLNVIVGKRSSGKTYNLNRIYNTYGPEKVKYIKQFELTKESDDKEFNKILNDGEENFINDYLMPIQKLTTDLLEINNNNDDEIDKYLTSLKENASNTSLHDVFSKCKLYSETLFDLREDNEVENIIEAVSLLIENQTYKETINKYILNDQLVKLYEQLVTMKYKQKIEYMLKNKTDGMIKIIKGKLDVKSAATSISDISFTEIQRKKTFITKFNDVVNMLIKPATIKEEQIISSDFKIVISKREFQKVEDIKSVLGTKTSLKDEFSKSYKNPYDYIHSLKDAGIDKAIIYMALCHFEIKAINKNGTPLSGGERAEYNLLNAIKDATNYDVLLLDEPEASFDNIFIKDNILTLLNDISNKTTVFITTHNNSLGVSIKPSKIIFTEFKDNMYKVYTGELGDKLLVASNGDTVSSHEAIVGVMEAGDEAYRGRKEIYENI